MTRPSPDEEVCGGPPARTPPTFDDAHGSLHMAYWLSREGYGTMDEAYASHIRSGDALVAQMIEARPAAAAALSARWAAWCAAHRPAGG